MKIIFKSSLALLFIALVMGCSTDDGVGSYAIDATPTLLSVEPGYERVRVKWKANATSSDASSSNVYWSGGDKSSGQLLTTGDNEFELIIEDVAEGSQTFYIQNATSTQNKYSAPSNEITVEVYGSTYSASLAARPITEVELDSNGGVITWGTAASDMIGTRVYYCDNAGGEAEAFFPSSDDNSTIANALSDTDFSYTTLYLPVSNCLDSIPSKVITAELSFPQSEDGIIKVSSPVMMARYMSEDNVYVLLETGDYRIEAADVSNGLYPYYGYVILGSDPSHSFFLVSGNNSTFDFGGSTVTVNTEAYDASASQSYTLHFMGSNNTVKNLTQIDEGPEEAWHVGGIVNITMDGYNNTINSVTVHAKSSYPYGYGELFGKGGNNVISHRKHSGIMVRGTSNKILACSLYQMSYGHGIFMQAAYDVTITDSYVEGEMTTTDEILAEEGTGSAADLVDFLTYWGFRTPAGFTLPLMEAGIRIYDAGNTIVNGERFERGSTDIRVTGCYVKHARVGVVLDSVEGICEVEDCTAVGCEMGFSIDNGYIKNCFSDCQYGPAFDVSHGYKYLDIEITIIPNSCPDEIRGYAAYNGSGRVANIYGTYNNIVIRAHESLTEEQTNKSYWIYFGGKNNVIGSQDPWEDRYEHVARYNEFRNETLFPIWLSGQNSSGTDLVNNNTIETAGFVYFEGDSESLNTVNYITTEE